MASTGETSVTSRPIRSSILPRVASKWSKPPSRRSTALFKFERESLRSVRVSPRPPNTSSSWPTVTSAFIAAWVSVLIRCRGGLLPALLSAMTLILTSSPDSRLGIATRSTYLGGRTAESSSLPLWKTAPARTRAKSSGALTLRQRACAASMSLYAMPIARLVIDRAIRLAKPYGIRVVMSLMTAVIAPSTSSNSKPAATVSRPVSAARGRPMASRGLVRLSRNRVTS